jgi:hypothetical protein
VEGREGCLRVADEDAKRDESRPVSESHGKGMRTWHYRKGPVEVDQAVIYELMLRETVKSSIIPMIRDGSRLWPGRLDLYLCIHVPTRSSS